jgi:hypothetical protein
MTEPVRWSATGRAVVSGSGSATITIAGPPSWWRVELSTVVVSSVRANTTSFPTCAVYRSTVTPSQLLGQSRSADAVTFDAAPGDVLLPGDQLIAVIAGALAGSTATVNAYGTQVPT